MLAAVLMLHAFLLSCASTVLAKSQKDSTHQRLPWVLKAIYRTIVPHYPKDECRVYNRMWLHYGGISPDNGYGIREMNPDCCQQKNACGDPDAEFKRNVVNIVWAGQNLAGDISNFAFHRFPHLKRLDLSRNPNLKGTLPDLSMLPLETL